MKLYFFNISLILVNVSSDYTKTDYTDDVFITNSHIELAYNMNNFTIKEKFVLNGLEQVIKTIIDTRLYTLEHMNNMFVVPEYLPEQCVLPMDWDVLRSYQNDLQDVIQRELNIPVPQIPVENFKGLDLEDLGVKRRVFTRKALKNILNRTINYGKLENVTNLIYQRSNLGTDNLENRISLAIAGPEKEKSLTCMCELIAMFIDDYEYDGSGYKTYRKIQGQWCQIFGDVVQPLKELL